MRTTSSSFVTIFAGATALLAAACSSSTKTPASPGTGGSTGGGGSGGSNGFLLMPNGDGFVEDATTGVVGAWYAYGDGAGSMASIALGTDSADSDCIKAGFTADECTQITTPTPGATFPPDPTNGMCTAGTAAKVIAKAGATTPDYSDLFGGGIGLDFNNPGGDAGTKKGDFDLSQYSGLSFDFSGAIIPAGKMRVNFPFDGENNGTDSPYWAANSTDDHSTITVLPGHNTVLWNQVLGPYYLTQQTPPTTPPPFLPAKAQSIQFQVFTNDTATVPYAFCVNNLTLLPK